MASLRHPQPVAAPLLRREVKRYASRVSSSAPGRCGFPPSPGLPPALPVHGSLLPLALLPQVYASLPPALLHPASSGRSELPIPQRSTPPPEPRRQSACETMERELRSAGSGVPRQPRFHPLIQPVGHVHPPKQVQRILNVAPLLRTWADREMGEDRSQLYPLQHGSQLASRTKQPRPHGRIRRAHNFRDLRRGEFFKGRQQQDFPLFCRQFSISESTWECC